MTKWIKRPADANAVPPDNKAQEASEQKKPTPSSKSIMNKMYGIMKVKE